MDVIHFFSKQNKPTILSYHADIIKQKKLLMLYKPLMNKFLTDVDVIVASSNNYFESSIYLQSFKNKVEVIPYGISDKRIDLKNPKLNYWKEQLGNKFFFFVGVHRYYKGLNFLIEALALRDLPTVIAGEGPMTSELKGLAKKFRLKNIKFIGEVSHEDKDAIFELSYAFVFPSHLRSESFGLSLLEASMYGKPMISCEIRTGTSFINLNNETGIVVIPENAKSIQVAMSYIWENPSEAKRMGESARQRYLNIFTSEKMCTSYLELYKKLLM
jgi:rhamnosyl/mannosyltransferase